jgi:RNA polymerase sigma-70 factor (ECF subfamily)
VTAPRAVRQPWLRAVPPVTAAPAAPPAAKVEYSEEEDQALVDAAARGDNKVAAKLYDRLIGVVNRSLFRIFGRRETNHDDLVQATFEQIIVTLAKGRFGGPCNLSAWASSITWHVALKSLRSQRRERRVLSWGEDPSKELSVAAPHSDLEQSVGLRKDIARIRAELVDMDPGKAEAFLLHDVFGHDLAEIAALTNVTVSAAQSRLVRGRKELYARLEEKGLRNKPVKPTDKGGSDGTE